MKIINTIKISNHGIQSVLLDGFIPSGIFNKIKIDGKEYNYSYPLGGNIEYSGKELIVYTLDDLDNKEVEFN